MKISIVSPVYNEEACVEELCRQLLEVLPRVTDEFEIVLVDDGSRDASWPIICALGAQHSQVKGVKFSRNFGHQHAISAGLDYATGEWIIVMDSDLQDPPEAIPELLDKAREGFDIVLARRRHRQYGWFKNLSAKIFYSVFRYLTDSRYDGQAGVYRIMSRKVVQNLRRLPEVDRFFPALVDWVGFRQSYINVTHGKRFAGETKYPLRKQIALAVNAMLSFSDKPIAIIVYFGGIVAFLSTLYAGYIFLRGIFGTFATLGYASLFTALCFFGGMTIATLGVVGLYVGRIFRQVKARPVYIVAETLNTTEGAKELRMVATGFGQI